MTMINEDVRHLIALGCIKGLGPAMIKSLVAYSGTPEQVFKLSLKDLMRTPGVGPETAKRIKAFTHWEEADSEMAFIDKHKIRAMPYFSKEYPQRLKELVDAPSLLFAKGDTDLNAARMLGVVGSRKATKYGKEITNHIIDELAPYNPIIVSGLAYGIDIEAHKAALRNGLQTIAVVAHGLDSIYPASHRKYAAQVVRQGAMVTEFKSRTQIFKEFFPRRNRVVAGLIDGLFLAETTLKGGALITADIAFSYSREVMAAPGRSVDELSSGCNQLIRMHKASLVERASDIAWIMGWPVPNGEKPEINLAEQLNDTEKRIHQVLKQVKVDGLGFDQLMVQTQLSSSDLSFNLLNMEFAGHVLSLPGNYYKIK